MLPIYKFFSTFTTLLRLLRFDLTNWIEKLFLHHLDLENTKLCNRIFEKNELLLILYFKKIIHYYPVSPATYLTSKKPSNFESFCF